jgi:hypothetical protein
MFVKNVCCVGCINFVAGFKGLPLNMQGYKKSEVEETYISVKLTEKKRKSKDQLEDTSQKVPLFMVQD